MSVMWIHQHRPRTAWYELDAEAQERLQQAWQSEVQSSLGREGTEHLGECTVRGVSRFERVSVWRFPTVAAVQDHWERLRVAGYDDWRCSENLLGVDAVPFEVGAR